MDGKVLKIAITGPIASGKSLVQEFFRQQGIITLDADKIAVWIQNAIPTPYDSEEEFPAIVSGEGTFDTDESLEWWIKHLWPKSVEGKEESLCMVPNHLHLCSLEELKWKSNNG